MLSNTFKLPQKNGKCNRQIQDIVYLTCYLSIYIVLIMLPNIVQHKKKDIVDTKTKESI